MSDNLPVPAPQNPGEFLLYKTEDGRTRLRTAGMKRVFTA